MALSANGRTFGTELVSTKLLKEEAVNSAMSFLFSSNFLNKTAPFSEALAASLAPASAVAPKTASSLEEATSAKAFPASESEAPKNTAATLLASAKAVTEASSVRAVTAGPDFLVQKSIIP